MTTESNRSRRSAFIVCLLVSALATLDISKVNVAIPAIESGLGVGPTGVQLITAGYVFAFGLSLIPSGRFGDLRSRRSMFIAGMLVFGIASVACGLAPNAETLVAGRGLQGLAAGMIMPQTLGIIQQLFTGGERGRAFGLYGAMVGLTVAIAPPLGGSLVALGGQDWGWRMVFLVNVPILMVCFPLALKYLPHHQPATTAPKSLDPLGILLLALTTSGLMLPFVLTTGTAADDPRRWFLLVVAPVIGTLFAFWERRYARRGRTPVLNFQLLQIATFRHGTLIALLYYAGAPAALLTTTLFFQHALDMEALQAGMSTIPFALAYIVCANWSGRAALRLGRPVVVAGLVIAVSGWGATALAAILANPETAQFIMPFTLMLAGSGAGMIAAPNQTLTLQEVPPVQGGLAGSITQTAQRLGSAIGASIAMSLYFGTQRGEHATGTSASHYAEAYRNAVLGSSGLMIVAIAVALVDIAWRRKHSQQVPGTEALHDGESRQNIMQPGAGP